MLTANAVENKLKTFEYNGENCIKNEDVENFAFPAFVLDFYEYVFKNDDIPTCEEIIELYISKHFDICQNEEVMYKQLEYEYFFSLEAVKARFLRLYPSIIRDVHFYLTVLESDIFDNVAYSCYVDYIEGIDLKVHYRNVEFPVALLFNTKRAKEFEEKKKSRHDLPDNIIKIICKTGSNSKKVGDFFLYSNYALMTLKSEIDKQIEISVF